MPLRPGDRDERFRKAVAKTFDQVRRTHAGEKIDVKLRLVRAKHGNVSTDSIYKWFNLWKRDKPLTSRSSAPKTNPRRIPPIHVLFIKSLMVDKKRSMAQLQRSLHAVGLEYSIHGLTRVVNRALLPAEEKAFLELWSHDEILPFVTDGIVSEKYGIPVDFARALVKLYHDKPGELPGSTTAKRQARASHQLGR